MNESMAAKITENILQQAVLQRASDIHIEPTAGEARVRYRVDGLLRDGGTLTQGSASAVLARLKLLSGMDIAEHRLPLDGRLSWEYAGRELDLRLATLPTVLGEKLTIRLLEKSITFTELEKLAFTEANLRLYRQIFHAPHGIVLLTGPTGSGKSTTLYATLRELNSGQENIITLEDPVEYQLAGVNQVAVNQKAGLTFASGMRALVRQDPDIIMVGEIRDKETAEMALTAALTGHLVFSTLHTNSAAGAVTRLLDMGAAAFLLAATLRGVLAQRLLRRLCPYCRKKRQTTAAERIFLKGATTLEEGVGCTHCGGSGYLGRLALQELLPLNTGGSNLADLIVRHADTGAEEALAQAARRQGYTTLYEDGCAKVLAGETTLAELLRVLEVPPELAAEQRQAGEQL